ncbi:MAG: alpha/beta fold hydrolase [Acutalibacteraceae bacterium]|nr:alpha/beta fold hydrolase [Acutalibacteraceae bacterium]
MNKGYSNDTIWKQIQEYLPEENRLNDNNMPNEEMIEFGNNTIHVDHYLCPNEKGVIAIYHGVGGNGRLLSFIAVPLCKAGYEVVCPDLPLYGHTICNNTVAYSDWVDSGVEVAKKYRKENKPLYLFGLSAGGMLAYQVSCKLENLDGLIVTCLLDQRINKVTKETASSKLLVTLGKPILKATHHIIGKMKIPMKFVCNMKAIVNNENLAKLLMSDPISSGTKVSLEFLNGMLNPNIEIEPEDYQKCPVLLVHPQEDYWTDVSLSELFFDKIKAAKELEMLCGAGHFPIEDKGLKQLEKFCLNFMESN